jgi:hypothetical protein
MGKFTDIVQAEYDSFPDADVPKDFDDFLVGGAVQQTLPEFAATQRSLAWQLSGVADSDDLKRVFTGGVDIPGTPENLVEAQDDLLEHAPDQVDIRDRVQYEKLFMTLKKRAYDIFDFLDIRSASMGDIPIKEEDLLLTEDDYYTIDYLHEVVTDYFALSSIATLTAFENMGIYTVKFRQLDECPICRATDGLLFETRVLINLLGSGSHVTHPYCDCQLLPVISREMYSGPLEGHLNLEEIRQGLTTLVNAPRELEGEIRGLAQGIGYNRIEFVDMKDHLFHETEIDRDGVVVIAQEGILYVHNSYVGLNGPAEFLRGFLREDVADSIMPPSSLEGSDTYFMGGRRVVKKDGHYWDPSTGRRIK